MVIGDVSAVEGRLDAALAEVARYKADAWRWRDTARAAHDAAYERNLMMEERLRDERDKYAKYVEESKRVIDMLTDSIDYLLDKIKQQAQQTDHLALKLQS